MSKVCADLLKQENNIQLLLHGLVDGYLFVVAGLAQEYPQFLGYLADCADTLWFVYWLICTDLVGRCVFSVHLSAWKRIFAGEDHILRSFQQQHFLILLTILFSLLSQKQN